MTNSSKAFSSSALLEAEVRPGSVASVIVEEMDCREKSEEGI
jgi:hypothetical protein